MGKPMFSVLIPAYNVSDYLAECLESVLNQTYKKWEAIVIDDGSTDDTGEICDSFAEKDNRFKVLHQKNQGISVTRNRLIDCSEGDYFLDSDDYWADSNMLCIVHNRIMKNKVDIAAWGAKLIDEKKQFVSDCKNCISLRDTTISGEDFIYNLVKGGGKWWGCLYAFKRSFWKECNITFHENRVICEDAELLYQVFMKAKRVCTIEKYFYCYRISRKLSLTGQLGYEKLRDMMEVAGLSIQKISQMNISSNLKECLCGNFVYLYIDSAPLVFHLREKQRKDGICMLIKFSWIIRYYKDFGNKKYRLKMMLCRLFGVRIGFWLLHLYLTIKNI